MSGNQPPPSANQMPQAMIAMRAPRLSQLRPGRVSGADLILPASLPQATIDPVKVTAPMKTPIHISCIWKAGASGFSMNALMPTSTAARPTKLCSWATSSGMPVISTLAAFHRPITAPMTMAMIMRAQARARVSPTASETIEAMSAKAMPRMPKTLPRLAVSCLLSPTRARMKSRPEMM